MTIPPHDLRRLADRLQVAILRVHANRARHEPSDDLDALVTAIADAAELARGWAPRNPDCSSPLESCDSSASSADY